MTLSCDLGVVLLDAETGIGKSDFGVRAIAKWLVRRRSTAAEVHSPTFTQGLAICATNDDVPLEFKGPVLVDGDVGDG